VAIATPPMAGTVEAIGTNYYVSNAGNDGNDGTAPDPDHAWLTIQHAVDTVHSGDTVNVAAGTYDAFLILDRNGISIIGEAGAVVNYGGDPFIMAGVGGSTDIAIESLDFDGTGISEEVLMGIIYVESTGSITDVNVSNVVGTGDGPSGIGIMAMGAGMSTLNISDTMIEGCQIGVGVGNDHVNLDNCTITGIAGGELSFGVLAADGAVVNVEGCDISHCLVENPELGFEAGPGAGYGIVVGIPGEEEDPVAVTVTGGSRIFENNVGIYVDDDGSLTANFNTITGNDVYGVYKENAPSVDATKNWWGVATGADPDTEANNPHGADAAGDKVSDNVDFIPWYATDTTTPGTENATVDHPEASIIAISDTIQGAIDAAIAGDTVNVGPGKYNEHVRIETEDLTVQSSDGRAVTTIDAIPDATGVYITAPSVTIDGFTITGFDYGIWLTGVRSANNCIIKNNVIENNNHGIMIETSGNQISNNTIRNNTGEESGIHLTSTVSGNVIHFNNIEGNSEYGVCNDNEDEVVDATDNWWGDASGPSGVGPGTGDAVSSYVDYDPWLGTRAEPSHHGNTATGTGTATFATSDGLMADLTAVNEATLPSAGKPSGVNFPHGLFSFKIGFLAPGATVTVTITLPSAVPVGTQYWKCQNGVWVDCTSLLGDDDGDNILTLTITDGGLGDSDGIANGVIVDPGGPAVQLTPPAPPAPSRAPAVTPPLLSVQYLNIQPAQTYSNQPVTISANVINTGGMSGGYAVNLMINGQIEQSKTIAVNPHSAAPVSFTVYKAEPGTYTVSLAGQQDSFTIIGIGAAGGGLSSPLIIGIVLIFAALFLGVLGLVMRTRRE